MLNAQQIVEQEIVFGDITQENIQQVGIDLNIIDIQRVAGGGVIPAEGKTVLAKREPQKRLNGIELELKNAVWMLEPGVYDITFAQGCKIPADKVMLLRQRSSLLRNGTLIQSSVFDPGFETENMGCVMIVNAPIVIEWKARVCQAYVHECTEVSPDFLYDGQFQNDKQKER